MKIRAEQLVQHQRVRMRLLLAVGAVLSITGLTGFGIVGNRQNQLLQAGTKAMATVVDAAPYGGGGLVGPNSLGTAHIDVQFADGTERLVTARLGIGDYVNYRPGQQVQIVYNPANPTEAVFARGYTDIGSIGFVLFAAIAVGICMAVFGLRRLLLWRRATRALQEPPRQMTATSRFVRRSRFQTWAVALTDDAGTQAQFWSVATEGLSRLEQPAQVSVFGAAKPGSVVVVVDSNRDVAIAGQIPKRWREPRTRRPRP